MMFMSLLVESNGAKQSVRTKVWRLVWSCVVVFRKLCSDEQITSVIRPLWLRVISVKGRKSYPQH